METKCILFFILIIIQTIRVATGDSETIIRNPKEFHDRLLVLKNRNDFCDAEITVLDVKIPVHKIILASSSEYFEKVFTENKSRAETKLENMDVEIAKSLIEYCYTGFISISEKNLREIMSAATFLKMTSIIEGCEKMFEKKMNSSNCISTWKLAQSKHLRKNAFEYIRQNYEKISQSSEFLDLNYSEILEILNFDIVVTSETIVFNSVKKWINHDSASRKQHLDGLSNFIRFEYLPKNILLSESHDFCSNNSSHKCHAKILNALQQKEKNNFESADNSFRDSYSTLMVVGSFHLSKTFEIFDLRKEKWIKIENFECNRIDYSAVLLEHKVMLIGGTDIKAAYFNTVQSYDLKTGAMENLPPMKYARYGLSAVEFKGRVYAIGGYNKAHLSYVEMWDPMSKIWKEVTSMTIPRWGFQAAVLDEEILVVGGFNEIGRQLSDVESYNPVTDKWKRLTSMNKNRYLPGLAVVGGCLYVTCGESTNFVSLNTVEKYDSKIDKWKMIHPLNTTKVGTGAANLFGKLVIVGGWNDTDLVSSMEMYDDENRKWISMPPLNDPRTRSNVINIPWRLAKATLSREIPK